MNRRKKIWKEKKEGRMEGIEKKKRKQRKRKGKCRVKDQENIEQRLGRGGGGD